MPQQFTVTLTDDEAAKLAELAAWHDLPPDDIIRRAVSDGLDFAFITMCHDQGRTPPREDGLESLPF